MWHLEAISVERSAGKCYTKKRVPTKTVQFIYVKFNNLLNIKQRTQLALRAYNVFLTFNHIRN